MIEAPAPPAEGVWADLVGQERAVAALQSAVRDPSAMSQAWLITGPPGSGRSNAARAFAAALECPDGGCGHCQACRTALAGTHPDVTLVTTDKLTIGIEEVRGLVQLAERTPSQGRWRVIVIEDADRMVERTANVLLKAIEEPTSHTTWVLCAPSPHDVIATVRSRCRSVVLSIPPAEAVAGLLERRDGVDHEMALRCATVAQSHIGVARRYAHHPEALEERARILREVSSVARTSDAVIVAGELVEAAAQQAQEVVDEAAATERASLLRSLGVPEGEAPPAKLRSQVTELERDAKRRRTRLTRDMLDRTMIDLLSLYRDVAVAQAGEPVGLVNEGLRNVVLSLADELTSEGAVRREEAVMTARRRLAANVAPLLAVEAMMVALIPRRD